MNNYFILNIFNNENALKLSLTTKDECVSTALCHSDQSPGDQSPGDQHAAVINHPVIKRPVIKRPVIKAPRTGLHHAWVWARHSLL